MQFKMEIICKSAQYHVTFPPGFHYGFNVRYQMNINTNAGNHLMDAFVKQLLKRSFFYLYYFDDAEEGKEQKF